MEASTREDLAWSFFVGFRAGLEEDEPEDEEDPELELLLSSALFEVNFFGVDNLA